MAKMTSSEICGRLVITAIVVTVGHYYPAETAIFLLNALVLKRRGLNS